MTDTQAVLAMLAAKDMATRSENRDGDLMFTVRAIVKDETVTFLGWEWFWRPPSELSPSVTPFSLKEDNGQASCAGQPGSSQGTGQEAPHQE